MPDGSPPAGEFSRDMDYPSGIVPAGPDQSAWLTPHGREELGGRPFGNGPRPGHLCPARRPRLRTARR